MNPRWARRLRSAAVFVFTLLAIEFIDELVFGLFETATPLIRDDLTLTYVQIGLLTTIPAFIANFIEPLLGILGDVWKRRVLVVGGGVMFATACLLTALSGSFGVLLAATILFHPASGAFVGLAQSALMDSDPSRHEQNMARWTFAGSLGVVGGPLLLGATLELGFGWRAPMALIAVLALALTGVAARFPFVTLAQSNGETIDMKTGILNALRALRRREVLRWLALLECSDFMLDILYGYLALYFVDVVKVSPEQAGVAVAVWTGVGLLGDFLLIPLLERVRGLTYLRVSAVIEGVLYIGFLLAPGFLPKVAIAGALGFFNSGWYSILKGQLYSAMPGQSGTVMTVGAVGGLGGSLIPLVIGAVAQHFGLGAAMWLMLIGPVVLLLGLPSGTGAEMATPTE